MPRILFFTHGMGVHGTDWAGSIGGRLIDLSANYSPFQGDMPLEKRVKLVPVTYDDVFTNHLSEWASSVDNLKAALNDAGVSLPFSLDSLEAASDGHKDVFWSHVVDVILYRFIPQVTAEVRVRVAERIVATLAAESNGGDAVEAHVLSHSLGTSVMHDTLAHLAQFPSGNPDTGQTTDAFTAERFRFATFITLANVTRILETTLSPYASMVHPASATHSPAYVDAFYNFRHELDPIPAVRAFSPVNWGSDYTEIRVDQIHEWNIHRYEHYLDNPGVHVPILERVCGCTIPRSEVPDYPKYRVAGAGEGKTEAYAHRLRQLRDLVDGPGDIRMLVVSSAQFLAAAKEQES